MLGDIWLNDRGNRDTHGLNKKITSIWTATHQHSQNLYASSCKKKLHDFMNESGLINIIEYASRKQIMGFRSSPTISQINMIQGIRTCHTWEKLQFRWILRDFRRQHAINLMIMKVVWDKIKVYKKKCYYSWLQDLENTISSSSGSL